MTLEEIFKLDRPDDIITELKKRDSSVPDIEAIKKQWNPLLHPVMDEILRPKKKILDDNGKLERLEEVGRIPLAFQELIVKRACSFLFGNPIILNHSAENTKQKEIVESIKHVLLNNRETTLNRQVGKHLMAATEVAEYWYTTEQPEKSNLYGFESKLKLRHRIFSPLLGDTLYPFFDQYGDLVAFSREFELKIDEKAIKHFEVYTQKETILYRQEQAGYEEIERKKNPIDKIPIVYATQGDPEWVKVERLIERLETLASNFADTNDYHASPTIIVKGTIQGFAKKGEQGKVLMCDPEADAHYLSWDRAPESIKVEKDMLIELIYTLTQTPNITFDNMKGLGAISGVALKLMFMDAHLKVEDKKEIISEYLQRRINVLRAYLAMMNTQWASVINTFDITPEIDPYMIVDEKSNVELMLLANGQHPLLSQKTSIEKSGLTINPEAEFDQIKAEAENVQRGQADVFNPVS